MTHVLVVEDTQAAAQMLCMVLQELGCTTDHAEDGAVALELLVMDAEKYNLILMDLRMPGLDGASAARRIHDAGGARFTPILAFSADRDPELDAALFRGAVPKPVEPETLLAAMVRAMA